jgi:hypothetical protein
LKSLLIAIALIALPVAAFAQTVPPAPEKIITIALPVSQWNIVLAGLGKLPLETAEQTFEAIQGQASKQVAPDDKKEPKK